MKDLILEKVSQEQIFQQYFPDRLELGRKYINPWRNDTHPGAFFTILQGTLYFVDFAHDPTHMDCFYAVKQHIHNDNFKEVLNTISKDFNLGLHRPKSLSDFAVRSIKKSYSKPTIKIDSNQAKPISTADIKVQVQDFNKFDLNFWNQYGITENILHKFNVKAVYRAWINDNFFHEYNRYDPIYRYREKGNRIKLYRPFANKWFKWRTNMSGGILEGWDELPETGDMVIITSSKKDVMSLYAAGFTAIATRSESSLLSENAFELLNGRFDKIVSLYNNDEAGIKYANKLENIYNIPKIFLQGDDKDPSDFIKNNNILKLKQVITHELNTVYNRD